MRERFAQDQQFGTSGVRAAHSDVSECHGSAETAANNADLNLVRSARLQSASDLCAGEFNRILEARWEQGDLTASNRAIADRYVGVDEKQIRAWRKKQPKNKKRIPLAALLVLPATVSKELEVFIRAQRRERMTIDELTIEQEEIARLIRAKAKESGR